MIALRAGFGKRGLPSAPRCGILPGSPKREGHSLQAGAINMSRQLEPYQLIERSIQKKFHKVLWTPFITAIKQ